MLLTNLWIAGKLVNGSLGTIVANVYKKDIRPPDLPLYILIDFDEYRGPCITNNYFPILPISKSWKSRGITFYRKQFTLILGHAFTIHRAQGLIFSKVGVL